MAPRHEFGPFLLDPGRGVRRGDEMVAIGHRGMALLEALLEADGQPVAKARLFELAWPGTIVEEVNLSVQIAALRKALGRDAEGREWITTVPRVGYCLPRERETRPVPTGLRRASIVVLPFSNMSSDPEQDYFADGVVEDLITALSRFKSFAVVARSSSFAYKGRAGDVRVVAEELGVRYVLEGGVQRRGGHLRVTAQLIDGETGVHLWAESFDGELENLFDFQDRITEMVAGLIEPKIRRAEIERARSKRPDSLDAYDLFLRVLPHFYGVSPDDYVSAIDNLERALALESEFPLILAYAAWAYEKRDTLGLPPLSDDDRARCLELARKALKFGGDDPLVLAICGYILQAVGGQKAEGLATVRRAVKANPNNVIVLLFGGLCNAIAGDLADSKTCYRRAIELCPGAAELCESISGMGFAFFFEENYDAAIEWLRRSLATFNDWPPTYWVLAAAYAHLDKMEDAKSAVARLREIAPAFTLAAVERLARRHDAKRFDLLISGLRKAGLPETIGPA